MCWHYRHCWRPQYRRQSRRRHCRWLRRRRLQLFRCSHLRRRSRFWLWRRRSQARRINCRQRWRWRRI